MKRRIDSEELMRILNLHQQWEKGEKDGIKADLSNCSFQDIELCGLKISHLDFSNSKFDRFQITDCTFQHCKFSEATFANGTATKNRFVFCSFKMTNIVRSSIENTICKFSNLKALYFFSSSASYVRLLHSDLSESVYRTVTADGIEMSFCDVTQLVFRCCDVRNSSMYYCTSFFFKVEHSTFHDIRMHHSNSEHITATDTVFDSSDFRNILIAKLTLQSCTLKDSLIQLLYIEDFESKNSHYFNTETKQCTFLNQM